MEKFGFIGGLVAINILTVFNCFGFTEANYRPVHPEKGLIDLRGNSFLGDNTYQLDGEWEFYWEKLLNPADFIHPSSLQPTYIRLGNWDKFAINGKQLSSKGFGTYRLRVVNNQHEKVLALALINVYSSAKLYINGELLAEEGVVGTSRETTRHHRLNRVVNFSPKGDTIEIIIQVANFYHQKGGLLEPPTIANNSTLLKSEKISTISSMVYIASLGFIGCFFLMLHLLFWNKDKAILYFSLVCLCWSYRTLSEDFSPLTSLFPFMSWSFSVRFEHSALYLGGLMGSLFLNVIFNKHIFKQYATIVQVVSYFFVAMAIFLPEQIYTKFLVPYIAVMSLNIGYILYVIIKAGLEREKGSTLAIIAMFVTLFVVCAHIYVFLFGERSMMFYINMGYIFIFLINSMLIAMRFSRSFFRLERLTLRAQEQNEEISSQSEKLSKAYSELNKKSNILKERNAQIESINSTLERKVMERTSKIAAINRELDTFLYKSSHDLRRPVMSILGLTNLAKRVNAKKESKVLFDKIQDMALDMDKLIHKLAAVNEINDHEIRIEKINLNSFIPNILEKVNREVINDTSIEFNLEHPDWLYADKLLMEKIIYQIILNSAIWVDHTNEKIIIDARIEVGDKQAINITFSDNGPGIPLKLQSEIFGMYMVADERTKSHGLGLYIVDKAVKKLGGSIKVESNINEGTHFDIFIPAYQKKIDSAIMP